MAQQRLEVSEGISVLVVWVVGHKEGFALFNHADVTTGAGLNHLVAIFKVFHLDCQHSVAL
jgi:hypothetical protein